MRARRTIRPPSRRHSRKRTCPRRSRCTPARRMGGALRILRSTTRRWPRRHGADCWHFTEKLWPELFRLHRPQDLLVQLLQTAKLGDPLFKGELIDRPGRHATVEPLLRFAGAEVE